MSGAATMECEGMCEGSTVVILLVQCTLFYM